MYYAFVPATFTWDALDLLVCLANFYSPLNLSRPAVSSVKTLVRAVSFLCSHHVALTTLCCNTVFAVFSPPRLLMGDFHPGLSGLHHSWRFCFVSKSYLNRTTQKVPEQSVSCVLQQFTWRRACSPNHRALVLGLVSRVFMQSQKLPPFFAQKLLFLPPSTHPILPGHGFHKSFFFFFLLYFSLISGARQKIEEDTGAPRIQWGGVISLFSEVHVAFTVSNSIAVSPWGQSVGISS